MNATNQRTIWRRLMLAGCLAAVTASADTYTWTNGAAGGNWSDVSKWYGGVYPPYAPDHVADLDNLPNGNVLSMNGNRQIGHIIFNKSVGNNQFVYYSAAANTLNLSCTTGQPTIVNGGMFRVIIAGTNGFVVDAGSPTRDANFWAGSTAATSYNTITGTVTVKSGRFRVQTDGSFYNITNIIVNNGATLYLTIFTMPPIRPSSSRGTCPATSWSICAAAASTGPGRPYRRRLSLQRICWHAAQLSGRFDRGARSAGLRVCQ